MSKTFFDDCRLSSAAIKHLTGLGNLRFLSLRGTEVGDAGMEYVAALDKLENLYLDGTRVTDTGMRYVGRSVVGAAATRRSGAGEARR